MAIREYIGARYVPKFMGEYSPTTEYEALCVVDDGLGTSYTSKIPTPAGTPLTNTTYWALTGSLNGAILHLQDEIDDINDYKTIGAKPELYGAVGDGLTDDTTAIQNCIDNNKIIYLSSKTYRITGALIVPEGVSIIGVGTIYIDYVSPFDVLTLNGNNTIKGITFSDSGSTFTKNNYVIIAADKKNINISDCVFTGIHLGYCMRFEHSEHIEVLNNRISTYSYMGICFASTCKHIKVNQNSVINGNFVDSSNNRYPICVSGYTDIASNHGPAENVECNYNYITDTYPLWEGIDSHGVINAQFVGNIIKNIPYGIVLTYPTSAGTLSDNGSNVTIRDNYIENTEASWSTYAKSAISVTVIDHSLKNLIIENNYCNMVNDSSITQVSEATSQIVVTNASTSAQYMSNIEIKNNYVKQKGSGICVQGINCIVQNVKIHDNRITGLNLGGSSYAIDLHNISNSFSNIEVSENYILPDSANAYSFRGSVTNIAHRLVKYFF